MGAQAAPCRVSGRAAGAHCWPGADCKPAYALDHRPRMACTGTLPTTKPPLPQATARPPCPLSPCPLPSMPPPQTLPVVLQQQQERAAQMSLLLHRTSVSAHAQQRVTALAVAYLSCFVGVMLHDQHSGRTQLPAVARYSISLLSEPRAVAHVQEVGAWCVDGWRHVPHWRCLEALAAARGWRALLCDAAQVLAPHGCGRKWRAPASFPQPPTLAWRIVRPDPLHPQAGGGFCGFAKCTTMLIRAVTILGLGM